MRFLFAALAFAMTAAAQAPLNCKGKLSEEQLTTLTAGKVPEPRLLQYVNQCGVGFAWSEKVRARLSRAGASRAVLSAVRSKAEEPAKPADQSAPEISYWNSIKGEKDPRFFQSYLARYPNGAFADIAKLRLRAPSPEAGAPKAGTETATAPATRAGAGKVNPKDGLTYVWIPPGRFTMGCSPGDNECGGEEKPAHEVEITRGFWMGQTPVTVGAWKRYRAATGKPALPTGDQFGRSLNETSGDDRMPVVAMTWDEARGFCEWPGGRLPTEAEWEYAARAGGTGARYGNLDAIAWYADNSGRQRIDSTEIWRTDQANYAKRLFDNGNGPHPVGQKEANAWNLYDMLGNVWQWTGDWYAAYSAGRQTDPPGAASGQTRTLRGGSWNNSPRGARASDRVRGEPVRRDNNIGFRCVGN